MRELRLHRRDRAPERLAVRAALEQRLLRLRVGLAEGHLHVQRAPLPEARALGPHLPAVQLDQLAHQREADAGPLVAARRRVVHLREAVEDPLELIGGNPHPGVRHRKVHAARLAPHRQLDPPARLRELQRIPDQVHQHLVERIRISVKPLHRLQRSALEPHALALRQPASALDHVAHQPRRIQAQPAHLQLAALDLRQIQQIVDQLQQPQPVRMHRANHLPHERRQLPELPRPNALQRRQHQRQRRPQLVMQIRRKPRLGAIQLTELIAGLLELSALLEIREPKPIEQRAARDALNRGCGRKEHVKQIRTPVDRIAGQEWYGGKRNQEQTNDSCCLPSREWQQYWHAQEEEHQSRRVGASVRAGQRNHPNQSESRGQAPDSGRHHRVDPRNQEEDATYDHIDSHSGSRQCGQLLRINRQVEQDVRCVEDNDDPDARSECRT